MEEQLQRIHSKLQQLLKAYLSLKKDNERKGNEILALKKLVGEQSEKIEFLQQQALVLKSGKTDMNPADKKEMEKKMNQYLSEINKCIDFLSK